MTDVDDEEFSRTVERTVTGNEADFVRAVLNDARGDAMFLDRFDGQREVVGALNRLAKVDWTIGAQDTILNDINDFIVNALPWHILRAYHERGVRLSLIEDWLGASASAYNGLARVMAFPFMYLVRRKQTVVGANDLVRQMFLNAVRRYAALGGSETRALLLKLNADADADAEERILEFIMAHHDPV